MKPDGDPRGLQGKGGQVPCVGMGGRAVATADSLLGPPPSVTPQLR